MALEDGHAHADLVHAHDVHLHSRKEAPPPRDPPVGFHASFKPPPRPKGFPGPGHYSCDTAHKALETTAPSYSIRLKCFPAGAGQGGISARHRPEDDTPGPNVYPSFTQFPQGPGG